MSAAARTRPRTSRHEDLAPLKGRELDAHDLRFVTRVVRSTPAAGAIGYDDALSAGLLEYWRAAERYDPSDGTPWTHFAARRVRGAVADEARNADHLSRCHRRKVNAGEDGGLWVMAPKSLDEPLPARGDAAAMTLGDMLAATDETGDVDTRLTIDAALEIVHLADARIAAALRLYYQRGWRDEDIAALFGVGHSRISQMRKQGRAMLAALLPLDLLDAA